MKTHELISLIEYISKIMAHYPNKSVEYALDDILNLLDARKKNPTPIVKEKQSSQILKKKTTSSPPRICIHFDTYITKVQSQTVSQMKH